MQRENKYPFLKKESILNSFWKLIEENSETDNLSLYLHQKYNLPTVLVPFLQSIGVYKDNFSLFLSSKIKDYLPDPFYFFDMERTVNRLADEIQKKTPIGVFGDYDVDGATSAAMLKLFFAYCGIDTFVHIPDRFLEGYGPNETALKDLISKGSNLIITVDCGISSFEPLSAIKNKKIDVIILDHHTPGEKLPPAYSIINPKRKENSQGYEYLCAAGVTFIMLVGLNRELRKRGFYKSNKEPNLMNFLDLVALGTVCDVVPLIDLNRVFVQRGIALMQKRHNIGIKSLSDISNLTSPPDVQSLSFGLGPRINAGGRIGSSKLGVNLLTESNEDNAIEIALKLDQLNNKRKTITTDIELEAIGMVEKDIKLRKGKVPDIIIVSNEGWHEGVLGIIAGRLKDKYNRPSCVISFQGEIGKGSARSIKGISVGDLFIEAMKNKFLIKGGGHDMAAGLTISKEKFLLFKEFINQNLKNYAHKNNQLKEIFVANILPVSSCNYELAEWIEKLGPWGEGAPEPNFIIENSKIKNVNRFGVNKEHISFTIYDTSGSINCKKFNVLNNPLNKVFKNYLNKEFNFLGFLKIDKWKNRNKPEFHLLDIIT